MKMTKLKGKSIYVIITICACIVTTFMAREIIKYHHQNYINMNTVVDFTATETGLYLYIEDGSGYYFERQLEEIKDVE